MWCTTSPQLEGKGGVFCLDVDIAEVVRNFSLDGMGQMLTGVVPRAIDPDIAGRLWRLSEDTTGVKFVSWAKFFNITE